MGGTYIQNLKSIRGVTLPLPIFTSPTCQVPVSRSVRSVQVAAKYRCGDVAPAMCQSRHDDACHRHGDVAAVRDVAPCTKFASVSRRISGFCSRFEEILTEPTCSIPSTLFSVRLNDFAPVFLYFVNIHRHRHGDYIHTLC